MVKPSKFKVQKLAHREAPHEKRLRLIYGPSEGLSIQDCVEAFKNLQGENKHERLQKNLRDSTRGHPVRWNEKGGRNGDSGLPTCLSWGKGC